MTETRKPDGNSDKKKFSRNLVGFLRSFRFNYHIAPLSNAVADALEKEVGQPVVEKKSRLSNLEDLRTYYDSLSEDQKWLICYFTSCDENKGLKHPTFLIKVECIHLIENSLVALEDSHMLGEGLLEDVNIQLSSEIVNSLFTLTMLQRLSTIIPVSIRSSEPKKNRNNLEGQTNASLNKLNIQLLSGNNGAASIPLDQNLVSDAFKNISMTVADSFTKLSNKEKTFVEGAAFLEDEPSTSNGIAFAPAYEIDNMLKEFLVENVEIFRKSLYPEYRNVLSDEQIILVSALIFIEVLLDPRYNRDIARSVFHDRFSPKKDLD